MSLYAELLERRDNPLRIGVIGAGKFGAMYIAQVPRTSGVHLVGIADLSPANAKENLRRTGWPPHATARRPKIRLRRSASASNGWMVRAAISSWAA